MRRTREQPRVFVSADDRRTLGAREGARMGTMADHLGRRRNTDAGDAGTPLAGKRSRVQGMEEPPGRRTIASAGDGRTPLAGEGARVQGMPEPSGPAKTHACKGCQTVRAGEDTGRGTIGHHPGRRRRGAADDRTSSRPAKTRATDDKTSSGPAKAYAYVRYPRVRAADSARCRQFPGRRTHGLAGLAARGGTADRNRSGRALRRGAAGGQHET